MNPLQAQHLSRGHQPDPCDQEELRPSSLWPRGAGLQCRISLAPVPGSTGRARDFTAATLRRWGLSPLIGDAVVVASELVTNAVQHGTGSSGDSSVGLAWRLHSGRLTCVVTDHSRRPPVLMTPGPDSESGRGLLVVRALAAAWGWTMLSPWGKAVWAELATPGS